MFLSPVSARRDQREVEYPGKPLLPGCIRLIRLLPGDWATPIRCELFEEPHGTTQYHALSYVWGSKNVTRPVFLNRKAFPVTVNLEGALRHLRERYKETSGGLILWVDALCIDQKDVEERTSQVQFMRQIYTKCKEVIVYLGDRLDGVASVDEAPKMVRLEGGDVHPGCLAVKRGYYEAYTVFGALQELATGAHLSDIAAFRGSRSVDKDLDDGSDRVHFFEAMRMMMKPPFTPWWSRIWVVQEIAVAPIATMTYGAVSASWAMFESASANCTEHATSCCVKFMEHLPQDQRNVLKDYCKTIDHIADLRRYLRSVDESTKNDLLLRLLLYRFREKKATDPRDKVYALLSIAESPQTRNPQKPMTPDYSLSEVEVFRQATLQCIYEDETLSLFSTELGRKFRNDLPSWVPDWGAPGSITYYARETMAELYNASPGVANEMTVRLVGHALEVNASYFETITEVGDVMWGGGVSSICKATLSDWLARCRGVSELFGTQHGLILDFWRIICGDVVCGSIGERRATQEDELTYVMWALTSAKSPFHKGAGDRVQDLVWSPAAKAWWCVLELWPDKPVLTKAFREQWKNDFPIPEKLRDDQGREIWRDMVIELLGLLDDESPLQWADWQEEDVQKLPWFDLLSHIEKRFYNNYDAFVELDLYSRYGQVPAFDSMVMAATECRRLITGRLKYLGLGPMDAQVGDQLFFLEGGKTPFVLRQKSTYTPQETRYEIVGDSYIQDMMDGKHAVPMWEKILLV